MEWNSPSFSTLLFFDSLGKMQGGRQEILEFLSDEIDQPRTRDF